MNFRRRTPPDDLAARQDPYNVTNASRIYFLPNLMTAGNLFCGFLALTKIVEADPNKANFSGVIHQALFLILLACVFDMLDGRVARMGGSESPFGREFDSLADIVSFGAAPAFLVHRIVLADVFPEHYHAIGWFIASVYLICGAFRLARFNCLSAMSGGGGKEFLGFPIPAAAGLVASLTLLLLWLNEKEFPQTKWRFVLPVILVFLSAMMVSEVKYPSFKSLDFRARRSFSKMLVIVLIIGFLVIMREKVLPVAAPLIFTSYLVYGFVRPWIPRKTVHDIEDEDEDEEKPRIKLSVDLRVDERCCIAALAITAQPGERCCAAAVRVGRRLQDEGGGAFADYQACSTASKRATRAARFGYALTRAQHTQRPPGCEHAGQEHRLAAAGNRVAVVDTDIQSPGIHVLFGFADDLDHTLNDYRPSLESLRNTLRWHEAQAEEYRKKIKELELELKLEQS